MLLTAYHVNIYDGSTKIFRLQQVSVGRMVLFQVGVQVTRGRSIVREDFLADGTNDLIVLFAYFAKLFPNSGARRPAWAFDNITRFTTHHNEETAAFDTNHKHLHEPSLSSVNRVDHAYIYPRANHAADCNAVHASVHPSQASRSCRGPARTEASGARSHGVQHAVIIARALPVCRHMYSTNIKH